MIKKEDIPYLEHLQDQIKILVYINKNKLHSDILKKYAGEESKLETEFIRLAQIFVDFGLGTLTKDNFGAHLKGKNEYLLSAEKFDFIKAFNDQEEKLDEKRKIEEKENLEIKNLKTSTTSNKFAIIFGIVTILLTIFSVYKEYEIKKYEEKINILEEKIKKLESKTE